MELLSIYVLYMQDIYISVQYTYIPVQYIYLFLTQLKYTTHIPSFWYSSFWEDCGSLATQTNKQTNSPCLRLLALNVI